MTASFLDGRKGRSLDNIIAKLSKVKSSKQGDRILLISEKSNACLSLSSDESEDGEADLHQCGACKEMFTSLSSYITHKIEKPCRESSRQQNHANKIETEAEEEMQQDKTCSENNKNLKVENDLSLELHKKKHDRKGMARKLTMTDAETSPLNENHNDANDNQVVVVVSSESERRFIRESEAVVAAQDRREEYVGRRQKEVDDAVQRNMPYLERIQNYTYESAPMYSHVPMSGYLPNHPDRTLANHEPEKDSVYRDRMAAMACSGEAREPWTLKNKSSGFYRGPNEVPGHYAPYPHSTLYGPQYSSISHPSSYNRYPNTIHTTQATKSCCSSAYAAHPQYPADLYTIPIEEYNKELYNKDRNEPSFKSPLEHDPEAVAKSLKIVKETLSSTEQTDKFKARPSSTTNKQNDFDQAAAERSISYTKEVGKDTQRNSEVSAVLNANGRSPVGEASDQMSEIERPPQLIKLPSPNSKENLDSPFSSQRLDSNETNSQEGGSRASSMSPVDSALSSSNHSLDHVISPSQVYERTSFLAQDDVSEDASKQSMEPESPCQPNALAEEEETSKAKLVSSGLALRGSENITPQDSRPSFVHEKKSNSGEVPYERRGETFKTATDGSPPNDASWRHSKQVYRCPLCAKIFPFKSKLQRHVLVHTGIKPYKCNVCGRGFTQQIDLQRHLTRHTGEKPFKCHLCKAQFIRADNLRKHAKDTHFVNIEEPIRKRRRKTTGSDTVLPPLEVAIAMAINETEKNGGRVLGRAGTRTNRGSSRRERMTSAEDEHRRIEQSSETFARPTMGTVSSHQYPVGPPSMGFPPHAPSMPPYSRISSEMYESMGHERSSSPPRLSNPPRYHPGSMVFQPRPDRYMERPYFARPPGEMPAMYWTSPPRHVLLSPSDVGPVPNRERFNSDASEGASSVFEGREDAGKSDLPNGTAPSDVRSGLSGARQGKIESEQDRYGPPETDRVSHKSLPPPHSEMLSRSPAARYSCSSEQRSPHMSDERPVHILDERGRFTQERMRSAEERLRGIEEPPPKLSPFSAERRGQKEAEESSPSEELLNHSPQRCLAPSNNESGSYHVSRIQENDEGLETPHEELKSMRLTEEKLINESPENLKRYDHNKGAESSRSEKFVRQNPDQHAEEKTNGLIGNRNEFPNSA